VAPLELPKNFNGLLSAVCTLIQLRLEGFIDSFVVEGARQTDVYDAIRDELEALRVAYGRDPDPADDQADATVENRQTNGRLSSLTFRLLLEATACFCGDRFAWGTFETSGD
jgi:hypothetical protein